MSDQQPARTGTLTLTGHRTWAGLWFGIASMGSVSGVIMVAGGAWAGWFLVVVFGPSAVVLGMALRPRANELVLDAHGYTLKSTFRSTTVNWRDVERIGVIDGAREQRVAIRFVPTVAARDPESGALAEALGGYHRTLPMSYGLDAPDLAEAMRGYAGLPG